MPKELSKTLNTANPTLFVTIDGDSQVEVTGTFGSVALTGPSGLVAPTGAGAGPFTGNILFGSVMTEMLFTLTGTGPVEVTVSPTRVANISKFE